MIKPPKHSAWGFWYNKYRVIQLMYLYGSYNISSEAMGAGDGVGGVGIFL